jgi:Na+-transporting NADH:ubiquinone oxidoreductase subunit NqrD
MCQSGYISSSVVLQLPNIKVSKACADIRRYIPRNIPHRLQGVVALLFVFIRDIYLATYVIKTSNRLAILVQLTVVTI